MLALFGAPLYASFFGKFAPVSVAGINSMDVCLPVISRYSGKNIVPVAIIHGIILEISVPLLIFALLQVEAGFILNTRYKHKRGCVHYIDASSCSFIRTSSSRRYLRTS